MAFPFFDRTATISFVATALTNYAPLTDAVFLTSPQAPTPVFGNSGTFLATTQFVANAAAPLAAAIANLNSATVSLETEIVPTNMATAIAGLTQQQLANLATAIINAVPVETLSAALILLIQSLPTDSTSPTPTLWSNGGILQYS